MKAGRQCDFQLFFKTARRTRQRQRIPLSKIANEIGISIPYLSEIERGIKTPSYWIVERIATILNLPAPPEPPNSEDTIQLLRAENAQLRALLTRALDYIILDYEPASAHHELGLEAAIRAALAESTDAR